MLGHGEDAPAVGRQQGARLEVGPEALFSTLGRTAARGMETVLIARRNADSLVTDRHRNMFRVNFPKNRDSAAIGRVLDGIAHKIVEDLGKSPLVSDDRRKVLGKLYLNDVTRGLGCEAPGYGLGQFWQMNFIANLQCKCAGLQPRGFEQIVDQHIQVVCFLGDDRQ